MRTARPVKSSDRISAEVDALLATFPRADARLHRLTLRAWLEAAEAWRIAEALERARGNRTKAARALGISRRTLYGRMEKLGIDPSRDGGDASGSSLRIAARTP